MNIMQSNISPRRRVRARSLWRRIIPAGSHALLIMLAAVSLSLSLSLSSCTQNRGHIGNWFGFWWLDRLLVDGEPDPDYRDDTTFSFMSDCIVVARNLPGGQGPNRFGTWKHEGNHLIINFDNYSDYGPYETPGWIYMGQHRVYDMTILKFNAHHLELEWVNDDGLRITYILRKLL